MKVLPKLIDLMDSTLSTIRNPDKTNIGVVLWEIFVWQEINKRSKKRRDKAWAAAQDIGVIPDDETLRATRGERTVAQSNNFACVVNTGDPRLTFDTDTFIKKVAKKYKLNESDLVKLAAKCVLQSKPVLTKRIAEIE